ncbi:hypothetical protein NQ317_004808 [Molorchus minor]|uniref:Uncharacterized protein n=1 Tax=Molorchus minor TaxID=1323400 RepID=A0ABQ9J9X4_9CUCU|nr:hypothetical protein NQ317_004808 [Molorchus minor]
MWNNIGLPTVLDAENYIVSFDGDDFDNIPINRPTATNTTEVALARGYVTPNDFKAIPNINNQ